MTLALGVTLLGLGLAGAFVAGLLGVGGAIVMIPMLLDAPPLLGVGRLEMKAVAAITMVQVFVAALSGVVAHRRHRAVNAELAWVGGTTMAIGSFAGAIASSYTPDRWLLAVFEVMVVAAGVLIFFAGEPAVPAGATPRFSRTRIALVAGVVGVAAGLVGAGGAFLLVPLLLVVVGVPTRTAIGSSLAITALAGTAGVVGKLVTGQVPLAAALIVALGAVPGAQLGAMVSRRMPAAGLRVTLGLLILVIAVRVLWELLAR